MEVWAKLKNQTDFWLDHFSMRGICQLHLEGEHKLSTLTFLCLEAISYARVLQNLKISCLVLKFIQIEEI